MRTFNLSPFTLLSCLLISSSIAIAAPGDILLQEDFESGLGSWTFTASGGEAGINTDTAASGINSLYLSEGAVTVTGPVVNTNVPEAQLSVWVRRGDDGFSENPDANEDLEIEYLDQSSNRQA